MTNPWITDRLKTLRRSKGGLAQALGIDPARVSEIVGGRRNVQLAELPAMAAYLEMTPDDLLTRLTSRRAGHPAPPAAPAAGSAPGSASGIEGGFPARPVDLGATRPARDLPIYGAAMGGTDGVFEMNGQIAEFSERPPALAGSRTAYGLYVQGDSMWPRFEAGWLVHVNPGRPVRKGDNVVIQIRPPDPAMPPLAYLKLFVARTATQLIVRQFNPDMELHWPLDAVISVHRVVGIAEM